MGLQLIWPWQDRQRRFSPLKASALALSCAPALLMIYELATGQFGILALAFGGLTYWSGVWATAILFLALAVTPAQRIFRVRALIDVRRIIGVSALVYSIAHIIIYFGLRNWNAAFILNEMATRLSLIVATLSTLGLIALGVTSFDAAVRSMGAARWQRLHDTVYAVAALAVFHALLSRGTFPEQYLMSGIFFWLMVWRLIARRGLGADPKTLALLAVASCLFAMLLEAFRLWLTRGWAPIETLGYNFSLDLGLPPAWEVLALGLSIALAAALRQAPRLWPALKTARNIPSAPTR
jgi:sulfoxide reductase heme-binding subunit YedZ